MRSLKLGLAATAVICALSATAQADCVKVGAVGEAMTHDIAVLFSTHGLANVIYGQAREKGVDAALIAAVIYSESQASATRPRAPARAG